MNKQKKIEELIGSTVRDLTKFSVSKSKTEKIMREFISAFLQEIIKKDVMTISTTAVELEYSNNNPIEAKKKVFADVCSEFTDIELEDGRVVSRAALISIDPDVIVNFI